MKPVRGVDPEFCSAIVALAEAFGHQLTELRIRLYARALADLTIDQFRAACSLAVRKHQYGFPSPGVLRGYVQARDEDRALVAWAALGTAAERVGAYASLDVEDGCAAEALRLVFGSWPAFCEEPADGPAVGARRQEFLAAYRLCEARGGARARRLPGLCEAAGVPPTDPGRVWSARLTAGGEVVPHRDGGAALTGGTRGQLAEAGAAEAGDGEAPEAGE